MAPPPSPSLSRASFRAATSSVTAASPPTTQASLPLSHPLVKLASSHSVVLQSSTSTQGSGSPTQGSGTDVTIDAARSLELSVALRRGRIVYLTALTVVVLLVLVLTFRHGVTLTEFDGASKTPEQQTKLLDDYNSYSGNVASVFGKPVELFSTAAVQVMILRFMTHEATQATAQWKVQLTALGLSAGAGYLINNGFAALNVQLRPLRIAPVVSSEDLSWLFNATAPALSTNATHTFPEMQARNPISNTILRNAVLPRVLNQQPMCRVPVDRAHKFIPETAVEFGFVQRDWQKRILQEALPARELRVATRSASLGISTNGSTSDVPMTAARAADLYLYGMLLLTDSFGMTKAFLNETEVVLKLPSMITRDSEAESVSVAKATMLLPPDNANINEADQFEWFLKASSTGFQAQMAAMENTSSSRSEMVLTHVSLSPSIVFDAITFEFDVEPMLFADASTTKNITRFTNIEDEACGPSPHTCFIKKPLFYPDNVRFEPQSQIQALAACVNSDGTEEIRANEFTGEYPARLDCEQASNSSMLVFSIAKRMSADAIDDQNMTNSVDTFDSSELKFSELERGSVVENIRKTYIVTLGRLSWVFEDLSSTFNASCGGEDGTNRCLGLQFPLDNTSVSTTQQRLVVGADSLSVATLSPPRRYLLPRTQRLLPLAFVREPPRDKYDTSKAGDLLMPHQIAVDVAQGRVSMDAAFLARCSELTEEHSNRTLNNHMYNEHGLQAAYTAAMFFLFENSVVKDTIWLSHNETTLDFAHNVRKIGVRLSIPNQSAWLTLAGCGLLVVGLTAALLQSFSLSHSTCTTIKTWYVPRERLHGNDASCLHVELPLHTGGTLVHEAIDLELIKITHRLRVEMTLSGGRNSVTEFHEIPILFAEPSSTHP